MDITASVGMKGVNLKEDVKLVQEGLNRAIKAPYSLLKVDGLIGPITIDAIRRFQSDELKFRKPDCLVEKEGKTWKALSEFLAESNQRAKISVGLLNTAVKNASSGVSQLKKNKKIAWGAKVSPEFKAKVIEICKELNVSEDFLMSCMAFETGETFSPNIKNAAGSGATGLIQFMPTTAKALGTSTELLAKMSAVAQLEYVKKYFMPYKNKLGKLEDVYMAILYPASIGKPVDHTLFEKGKKTYTQNKGFDSNRDGKISLAEISTKVRAKYGKGLKAGYIG